MKQYVLFSAMLSLAAQAYAENVTADPADGSVVASLSQITLTWADEAQVDNNGNAAITITNAEGNIVVESVTSEYGTNENQMVLTFTEIAENGIYTVNVPAERYNFLSEDGTRYSEAFSLTYTIGEGGIDTEHTFTPDGTVGYLYSVDVAFVNYAKAAYKWNATAEEKPYVTDAEGKVASTAAIPYAGDLANTNKVRVVLDHYIATPGIYTLHVPAGACNVMEVMNDYTGVPCTAFTHDFTITGEGLDAYTVTPSAEVPVRNAKAITITFVDVDTVAINPTMASNYSVNNINIWNSAGTSAGNFRLGDGKVAGNSVTYTLSKPIINGDLYTCNLSPDFYLLGEDKHGNSPVHIEFTVDEGEETEVEITPASGETYSRISEFTFTFAGVTSVAKNANVYQSIYVYDHTGKTATGIVNNNNITYNGNVVTAKLNIDITEADDYTLTVPTGFFIFDDDNDKYNTAIRRPYTVDGTGIDVITCDPANGSVVDSLYTIVITFDNETVLEANASSYASITVYDSEKNYVASANMFSKTIAAGPEANQATITLNKVLKEEDTYTFKLPGNAFFLGEDKRMSTPQNFTYTVDHANAIESVEKSSATRQGIYTIDGRKVEKTAQGLYIVNGKVVRY